MAGAVTEEGAAFMAGVGVVADSTAAEAVAITVVAEVASVQAVEAGLAGEDILHQLLVTAGRVVQRLHLCGQEAGSRRGRGTTSIGRAEILRAGTNALGTTAPLPLPSLTGSGIPFPHREGIADRSVLNLRLAPGQVVADSTSLGRIVEQALAARSVVFQVRGTKSGRTLRVRET